MTPDEKIKHLYEHVQRLRLRIDELEQFRDDVMKTILNEKPVHEKDTDHD